uniref:RNase III domain-containing protein n=1 Tax=Macrostomum lignano TaxID=282301 RepID=A0A1I8F4U9_9PLAT
RPARLPLVRHRSRRARRQHRRRRGLANVRQIPCAERRRDFGVNRSRTGSPANRIRRIRIVIGYRFRNRAYLCCRRSRTRLTTGTTSLTAISGSSFWGDAYLFHDSAAIRPPYSPISDRLSASITTFSGALAVKWGFHSTSAASVPLCTRSLTSLCSSRKDDKADNWDFVTSEEADFDDRPEDVEIPKCLGDIFESVAGAVFLDSGMSLDTVVAVFYPLMKERIECYTAEIPKSLFRELLETEPDCHKVE